MAWRTQHFSRSLSAEGCQLPEGLDAIAVVAAALGP